jgi:ATP adenylyltransferase
MDRMWSPWRSEYMDTFKQEDNNNKSFIIYALEGNDDEKNLVVARFDLCIVMMNKYPYNNGHILIAPNREVSDISLLTDEEYNEINKVIRLAISVIKNVYQSHGYNLGVNAGSAAGAGLPNHLHYHIVPRWNGDSNFMPTIADVKVVSESIFKSRKLLADEFIKLRNNE